jgi:hypothetical protein
MHLRKDVFSRTSTSAGSFRRDAILQMTGSQLCNFGLARNNRPGNAREAQRRSPVAQLRAIFGVRNHPTAFAFVIALVLSVFTVVPFMARRRCLDAAGAGG